LFGKIRDGKATGILDIQEKGKNIDSNRLFVSLRVRIILTSFILVAGTPGFAGQWQLGGEGDNNNNDILYLFCDWNTSWSLIYRPINENQRTEIDKIVKVPKNKYLFYRYLLF